MATRANIRLPQLQIIWLAIASSVLVYGAVAFIAIPKNPDHSTERLYGFVSNPLSFALGIAALVAFFASYVIPGLVLRSRTQSARTEVPRASATNESAVSPEVMSALIVRFALLEAPAIFGLVGAFVMAEWRLYLPFGVLSLLGLILTFPTASLIRSLESSR